MLNESLNFTNSTSITDTVNNSVFIFLICYEVASGFAIISNSMIIFTLFFMTLKHITLKYMLVISISDLLWSSCAFFYTLYEYYYGNDYFTKLFLAFIIDEYFTSVLAILVILCNIYIAMDRLLNTMTKTWFQKISFKISLAILLVTSLLYYAPVFSLYKVDEVAPAEYALHITHFAMTDFGSRIAKIQTYTRIGLLLGFLPITNVCIGLQLRRLFHRNFRELREKALEDHYGKLCNF